MFSKTLYKRDQSQRIREWTIEVEGNAYRTISGLIDGEKVTSEWTYCFGKNQGRANATSDEEQAIRVAETLIRIRREQGSYDTIEDAGKGKAFFQPMLASKWDNLKDKITVNEEHPIYVQRKLDGSRCIVGNGYFKSRTGKDWISAPHIYEKLKPVFEKYPDLLFDGELYFHSTENNFNEVISLIKKTKPTEEDLKKSAEVVQYWIYDLPSNPNNYLDRWAELQKIFLEFPDVFDHSFVLVDTYVVTDKTEVQQYLEKFVSEGYEGAIVRLNAPYESKRSKNLLKVKEFNDEEFPILRIEEGRGNLSGCAGRIIVDVDGVEVGAGLRFSRDEAREIWQNREYYTGKMATVKYFGGKTPDGSLRFPKVIQIDRESYE